MTMKRLKSCVGSLKYALGPIAIRKREHSSVKKPRRTYSTICTREREGEMDR